MKKKITYNKDNHPKVRNQPRTFKETIYPTLKLTEINIDYNGGKKFHRQYMDVVTHLQNLSGSPSDYGARLFLYMLCLTSKRGNTGFKVCLDKTLFVDRKGETSYQSWVDTLEALTQSGYGTLYRGCSTKDDPEELLGELQRYVSVFKLTPKVFALIANKDSALAPKAALKPIDKKATLELTIKHSKGGVKWEEPLTGVRGVRPYRKNLNNLNEFLRGFEFKDKKGVVFDPLHRRKFSTYADQKKNLDRKIFDSYGRYINVAQSFTEGDRAQITIDGQPVVEIDYSSNHARIAYELEDIRLDEDFKPYSVNPKDCPLKGSAKAKRAVYKAAMMMLFNSGNPTQSLFNDMEVIFNAISNKPVKELPYRKRIFAEMERPNMADCSKVIRSIKKNNTMINDYFTGKQAPTLQNLDSKIAEQVMLILKEQGIPCLCIHDSFIVPKQHHKALYNAMFEAWERVLGSADCCVVDYKQPVTSTPEPVAIIEQQEETTEADLADIKKWVLDWATNQPAEPAEGYVKAAKAPAFFTNPITHKLKDQTLDNVVCCIKGLLLRDWREHFTNEHATSVYNRVCEEIVDNCPQLIKEQDNQPF